MIYLPKDVQNQLEDKYPDLNIKQLVHDIFTAILNKSYADGACIVPGFGSFFCFKTFSKRFNRNVIRFKYKISRSLNESIRFDKMLLKSITNGTNNQKFVPERITQDSVARRNENKSIKESKVLGEAIKKTKKRLQIDEIMNIIKSEGNNTE